MTWQIGRDDSHDLRNAQAWVRIRSPTPEVAPFSFSGRCCYLPAALFSLILQKDNSVDHGQQSHALLPRDGIAEAGPRRLAAETRPA